MTGPTVVIRSRRALELSTILDLINTDRDAIDKRERLRTLAIRRRTRAGDDVSKIQVRRCLGLTEEGFLSGPRRN